MDGMGCERSEVQRFCCENILFRRYGNFNGLIVLCHLELLMIAEKSQKVCYFTLKLTKSSCTCIASPAKASM